MILKILLTIKNFFVFIYEDTKKDLAAFRSILDGDYTSKYSKEELKAAFDLKEMLKTYWPFFLLLIATACVSWFIAAKYYQNACNSFILAQQAQNPYSSLFPPINFTGKLQ